MKNMKKIANIAERVSSIVSFVFILAFCAFTLVSCADADGLHDQNAVMATFQFVNFGDLNGDLALAGDFDGDEKWEKEAKSSNIKIKAGEGATTEAIPVTSTWIKFSLCEIDSNWSRKWYPAIKGNAVDTGTAGNPQQNFYIGNLDLSAGTMTIVIDGSKSGTDAMVSVK